MRDATEQNNFDPLRLLLSTVVMLFHVSLLSQARDLAPLRHLSSTFAVQAFFVLSGFLVTMSYEKSYSVSTYLRKRLRRILPAYTFVVVFAALALSFLSTFDAIDYFRRSDFWRYLGFNLILSNFSAPELPGVFRSNFETAVNGSLWTIKIEMAFYCSVPFLVWAVRRYGEKRALICVLLSSILWKVGFDFGSAASGLGIYAKLAKQLPGQLGFFIGGVWAFYRTRAGVKPSGWAAAMGACAYWYCDGLLLDLIGPVAVSAIVWWAAVGAPMVPRMGSRGDFSYGIYLYHFPIAQSLISVGIFRWSPLAGLALTALTTLCCAVASWRWIEKPMIKSQVEPGFQSLHFRA